MYNENGKRLRKYNRKHFYDNEKGILVKTMAILKFLHSPQIQFAMESTRLSVR